MTVDELRRLARFASEITYDRLPETSRRTATLLILDTLGVILAGSIREELRQLRARLPQALDAQVIARGLPRSFAPDAAFANAVAGSFLELDQGERPTGHPALHALPSLLAHAQAKHNSGKELLTAFVVTYEVQSRIQGGYSLHWPVHPHGTLGTPAAAAGLGRLDNSDAETLFALVNCGASLVAATSWNSCFNGATTRNAFAGMTAQTAFLARTLISSGFTATNDAVQETFGRILGEARTSEEPIDDLGSSFAVDRGYVKFHAACALAHPALDALLEAAGTLRVAGEYPPFRLARTFTPAEVTRVDVRTTERASRLSAQSAENELAAKFSIPVAVATMMVHGSSEPSSFVKERVHDARVRDLATRVVVTADQALTNAWPEEFGAEVEIRLQDGSTIAGSCSNPYGSAANPASIADLRAKFETLVGSVLGPDAAARAWTRGNDLANSPDIDAWLGDCFTSSEEGRD